MRDLPGVSDIDFQYAKLQEKRQADMEMAQNHYQHRLDLDKVAENDVRRFTPNRLINWNSAKIGIKVFILANIAALGLNTGIWSSSQTEKGKEKSKYLSHVTYKDAMRNAFIGSDIDTYGRRAAAHTMLNMLTIVFAVLLAYNKAQKNRRTQYQYAKHIHDALKYGYTESELPVILQTNLGKFALDIIKKMSEHDPRYFNGLVYGGHFSDATYNLVLAIIEGHLKSNPKDINTLLNHFNDRSIPIKLISKYYTPQKTK